MFEQYCEVWRCIEFMSIVKSGDALSIMKSGDALSIMKSGDALSIVKYERRLGKVYKKNEKTEEYTK